MDVCLSYAVLCSRAFKWSSILKYRGNRGIAIITIALDYMTNTDACRSNVVFLLKDWRKHALLWHKIAGLAWV